MLTITKQLEGLDSLLNDMRLFAKFKEGGSQPPNRDDARGEGGEEEMFMRKRAKITVPCKHYATVPCKHYATGCKYGDRCRYAHPTPPLQARENPRHVFVGNRFYLNRNGTAGTQQQFQQSTCPEISPIEDVFWDPAQLTAALLTTYDFPPPPFPSLPPRRPLQESLSSGT